MGIKLFSVFAVFVVSAGLLSLTSRSTVIQAQGNAPAVDEVLVRFHPLVPQFIRQQVISGVKNKYGGSIEEIANQAVEQELNKLGMITLHVPHDQVNLVTQAFSQNFFVDYAEPNFIAEKLMATSDPSLHDQWGIYKIKAADDTQVSAWDADKGDANIKVAVLDTGVDASHPDLDERVILQKDFSNSGSGFVDMDGHGSHIAGAIAAETDNGIGVAGVGYRASILNGKVLGDNGSGTYSSIAAGITWAADNGARVINMSLGGTAGSSTLKNAIDYAYSKGVVIIAAAGNSGNSSPIYPGYYDKVIAEAATDQNDAKPDWSNYGSWVDVAAPGVAILSTYKNGGYATYSGTSMATSYVSGAAVLAWETNKCSTNTCIVDLIESTADKINGTGSWWTFGRINALNIVNQTVSPSATLTMTPIPTLTLTPSSPTPTSGPSATPTPTAVSTATPTPTPTTSANKMTVSDITMWYTTQFGFVHDVYTKVKVVNPANNSPVSGAAVNINLTYPAGFNFALSGNTNTSGEVTLINKNAIQTGAYTSRITSVSKNGIIYEPSMVIKNIDVK